SAALFSETYGNAAIRALTRASRSMYEVPPEGFAQNELLSPRSVLYIARDDQRDGIAAMADILGSSGKTSPVMTPADICRRVSIIRPDYV
ncbi:hypothetical protein, partial [Escherichia coli]